MTACAWLHLHAASIAVRHTHRHRHRHAPFVRCVCKPTMRWFSGHSTANASLAPPTHDPSAMVLLSPEQHHKQNWGGGGERRRHMLMSVRACACVCRDAFPSVTHIHTHIRTLPPSHSVRSSLFAQLHHPAVSASCALSNERRQRNWPSDTRSESRLHSTEQTRAYHLRSSEPRGERRAGAGSCE